jgi:hypothetical protein
MVVDSCNLKHPVHLTQYIPRAHCKKKFCISVGKSTTCDGGDNDDDDDDAVAAAPMESVACRSLSASLKEVSH